MPSFADQIISFLLNLQKIGHFLLVVSFTELDDGKIYRKPLYLMVKTHGFPVDFPNKTNPLNHAKNHHSWFIPYFCWLNLHGWLKATVPVGKTSRLSESFGGSNAPCIVSGKFRFKFQVPGHSNRGPVDGNMIGEYDWAMNKIPWWIDCEKGDLILPGLLGIMISHSGETYQPTSISWDGIGVFLMVRLGKHLEIWDDSDHIVPSYHHDVLFHYVYL